MRRAINRRDFLKLTGMGAAAAALAGARAAGKLPREISWAPQGISTWLPDGRGGFPARVYAAGGHSLGIGPNPSHPLAHWFDRAAGERALESQDDARLLRGPLLADGTRSSSTVLRPVGWAAAVNALSAVFSSYHASEIAFIAGAFPDHLYDFIQQLAAALGGASVLRLIPESLADGRVALQNAAWQVFGLPRLPFFDLDQAGLVYAFGVRGNEPWLAGAEGRQPSTMRRWVFFDSLPPEDPQVEWVKIPPGSHAQVARALASGVARLRAGASQHDLLSELIAAGEAGGVDARKLAELTLRFSSAGRPLAVPGGRALVAADGASAARMILELNAAVGALGKHGGVYLPADAPMHPSLDPRPATLDELAALVERIRSGQVKALLVHGADPAAALPQALDVRAALANLERLVSFDSLYNETDRFAHLVIPDRLPIESSGYQRVVIGADRPLVAAVQPALTVNNARRPAADVLLAAARQAGMRLPYLNGADFLGTSLRRLQWLSVEDPYQTWQVQGGWWTGGKLLLPPVWLQPI